MPSIPLFPQQLTDAEEAAVHNGFQLGGSNPVASVKQLPIGRVSVTRIADGSREYAPQYTDLQNLLLAGDIVDLYYPITAVLPPNTRTVLSVSEGVRVNLNGQSIGQDVPHDNKVGMLLKFGKAYVNGGGAVIYGFGAEGKAIETADSFGSNYFDYAINSVNVEVAAAAIGVHSRRGGILRHTGDIATLGDGCVGVKVLTAGRYVGQGTLNASGTSLALLATQAGSIRYTGRINLPEKSLIQALDAGSRISLEQIVVDGQTDRTAGNYVLVSMAVGTVLVLTDATILGEPGQTVIQADTVIYRGLCKVVGNVVATTVIGAPNVNSGGVSESAFQTAISGLTTQVAEARTEVVTEERLPEREFEGYETVEINGQKVNRANTEEFKSMLTRLGISFSGNGSGPVTISSIAVTEVSGAQPVVGEGLSITFKAIATYSNGTTANISSTAQFGAPVEAGTFTANTLAVPANGTVGDTRTYSITATKDGVTSPPLVVTINDTTPAGGSGEPSFQPVVFRPVEPGGTDGGILDPTTDTFNFTNTSGNGVGTAPSDYKMAAGTNGRFRTFFDVAQVGFLGASLTKDQEYGTNRNDSAWIGYNVSNQQKVHSQANSAAGVRSYQSSAEGLMPSANFFGDLVFEDNFIHTEFTRDGGTTFTRLDSLARTAGAVYFVKVVSNFNTPPYRTRVAHLNATV